MSSTMNAPSSTKSSQGSRVARELELLRQKQLAKNQRQKLNDLGSPLTTPEDAKAFLAAMRNKSHEREFLHKPPSNISADGMDSWYMQQRKREQELRERRKEAEALLRGYRGYNGGGFSTPTSQAGCENLDDPSTYNASYSHGFYDTPPVRPISTRSESGKRLPPKHFDRVQRDDEAAEEKKDADEPFKPNEQEQDDETSEEEKDADELKVQEQVEKEKDFVIIDAAPMTKPSPPAPIIIPPVEPYVPETVWRDFISVLPGAKFPVESGRYHLYLSFACPGSHRALIVRALKGLENVISVTNVHPTWRLTSPIDPLDKHRGWVFGDPFGEEFANTIGRGGPFPPAYSNTDPDPEFNAYSVRQLYEYAGDNSGKYTIPLLWDKEQKTIVNNESSDIAYMLNSCFNKFAKNPDLDLYTEDDEEGRVKLNEVSEWLTPLMIHGIYRCGFAKNQIAYDLAIAELCDAYDRADDILQVQRYLTGDTLTDADIRLFVTLIRFDEVFSVYFKANARLVMLTPSLLNFCREIFQMPGIAETCDMDQIKAHFYGSHAEWNKYSVIPRGLGFMELLDMPHDRDEMTRDSPRSIDFHRAVNDGMDDTVTAKKSNDETIGNGMFSAMDDEQMYRNPTVSDTTVSNGILNLDAENFHRPASSSFKNDDDYRVYSNEASGSFRQSYVHESQGLRQTALVDTLSGPMSYEASV